MHRTISRPDESYYTNLFANKCATDEINYDKLVNLYIELGSKFNDYITLYDASKEINFQNSLISINPFQKQYTKDDFISDILNYVTIRTEGFKIAKLCLQDSDKLLEFI